MAGRVAGKIKLQTVDELLGVPEIAGTQEIELGRIHAFPNHPFKVLDGLVTNFHLPESTLIMLISAFLGYEKTMHAYEVAVQEKYRFFSFGDAMCILPEKK